MYVMYAVVKYEKDENCMVVNNLESTSYPQYYKIIHRKRVRSFRISYSYCYTDRTNFITNCNVYYLHAYFI